MRGLVLDQWLGLFVAAGHAARDAVARLNAEVSKALAEPAVRERYAQLRRWSRWAARRRSSRASTARTSTSTGA